MKARKLSGAADPALEGELIALRRAAQRARQTAARTNTRVIVLVKGKLRRLRPTDVEFKNAK
jgi:outer membrane murein-binding lipoprotein Lpp